MLKVLYLPLGNQSSTADAFVNVGCQLEQYDFWTRWEQTKNRQLVEKEFLDKVRAFQPKLIHMQLQFTGIFDARVLHEARKICPEAVITNWTGDCRDHAMKEFVQVASSIDYSLISSTGQLEMYRQAGVQNAKYWQIGYDPKFSFPMNYDQFEYDLTFIGNNYGATFPDSHIRMNAVNFLTTALPKFKVFGSGYPGNRIQAVDPKQMNGIYNKSLCVLSISHFNNVSHYFSDRLLYCLASGRPTITWDFPGCDSYFVENSEIFIARSNQDILDIVRRCQADPQMAKQVGINGQLKVLKEHTFTSRIIELLHITNLTHLV